MTFKGEKGGLLGHFLKKVGANQKVGPTCKLAPQPPPSPLSEKKDIFAAEQQIDFLDNLSIDYEATHQHFIRRFTDKF